MDTAWIQTSSATVNLKASISSAMASAGVLHPRVFLGRLFIRFATSFGRVWLASLGRPVQMHELAMNETIKIAPLHKLAFAAAARAPGITGLPRHLRAIAAVFLPTSRQLTADRARRAMQKLADRPLAAASIMLGEYHATVLAAEVLASYVHRNILGPKGSECCI
jgi:hypothetical protein